MTEIRNLVRSALGFDRPVKEDMPPHRKLYVLVAVASGKEEQWRAGTAVKAECETICPSSGDVVELALSVPPENWTTALEDAGSSWVVVSCPWPTSEEHWAPHGAALRRLSVALMCARTRSNLRCFLALQSGHDPQSPHGGRRLRDELLEAFPLPQTDGAVVPTVARVLIRPDRFVAFCTRNGDTSLSTLRIDDFSRRASAVAIRSDAAEAGVTGDLADYQEQVFNSDPAILTVRYDARRFGRDGSAFVAVVQDAIKWNTAAHTFDLADSLCGGPQLVATTRAVLHTNRYLRTLVLSCCSITDDAAVEFAEIIARAPYITHLDLSRNPGIGSDGIACLGQALGNSTVSALKHLDVSNNNSLCTKQTKKTGRGGPAS